jgi:hypothetical protein
MDINEFQILYEWMTSQNLSHFFHALSAISHSLMSLSVISHPAYCLLVSYPI